ncbi:YjbF family lipoprotein [Jannaschia aquimarina]|uniref:Group 4 capsule polysaccharide lipoprotein gfcB, YjbF n=1 Tax=Jannaschia aquimarina TaxID=935700 RepID=A0A0D1EH55_9RHOB|nr:YjbF family lipoprotein [Jannaschia aquimarina]KIT17004.1 hypothetical protein jaqu_11940 [Jannaschia aquimarina]SNS81279.1 Group 4 capsule polysaccharide lipoprotein gfcB, YjbF [Jannaschia aquimarina]
MKRLLAILSFAVLAGCGSEREPGGLIDLTTSSLGTLIGLGSPEPESDVRPLLSPAFLEQVGKPVLLVVDVNRDQAAGFTPVATGVGNVVQWRDGSGIGVLLRSGILVGTRGLGFDLLTADVDGLIGALGRGGGEDVLRVERRLRGDSTIEVRDYLCDVVPVGSETIEFYGQSWRTSLYEERCVGEGQALTNRYWVDTTGAVRRQQVEVSDELGRFDLSLLRN